MSLINYIIWNPSTELFRIGFLAIRWYSLMIIVAFLVGKKLISYYYQKEGRPIEDVENLSVFILTCCLVGARLGEILFYNPAYYLKNPLEALLPITFSPHFQFVGYKGLSYHGALLGGLVAVYLYANYQISLRLFPFRFRWISYKRPGQNFLWLLTPLAFGVLMGFFVRIGNFINSEILGTPTHNEYGILFAHDVVHGLQTSSPIIQKAQIFKNSNPVPLDNLQGYQPIIIELKIKSTGLDEPTLRNFLSTRIKDYLVNNPYISQHVYEPSEKPLEYTLAKTKKQAYVAQIFTLGIPRHPVQLYESFTYILTLLGLFYWWQRKRATLRQGVIAGLATIISYSFRFVYEFFKDPFSILIPGKHPITTGHLLSLLTVLLGILILIYAYVYPQTNQDDLSKQQPN